MRHFPMDRTDYSDASCFGSRLERDDLTLFVLSCHSNNDMELESVPDSEDDEWQEPWSAKIASFQVTGNATDPIEATDFVQKKSPSPDEIAVGKHLELLNEVANMLRSILKCQYTTLK